MTARPTPEQLEQAREALAGQGEAWWAVPVDETHLRHALAEADALRAERDEAVRLRESDSKSLEFWIGELRKVAEAMGLDGSATVTNMVDWARAGRWEIEARIAMERERDEARAKAAAWREWGLAQENLRAMVGLWPQATQARARLAAARAALAKLGEEAP